MVHDDCPFCGGEAHDRSLDRRRQWGTDWFSVYRDKAQIVPSHNLVIPHEHVTAFAELRGKKVQEICISLRRRQVRMASGVRTIVFEHGILDADTRGCGVCHAHWHVVDLTAMQARMFFEQVSANTGTERRISPAELCACTGSYLFLWGVLEEHAYVFDGRMSPSQFMRKSLATVVGAKQWDWRVAVGTTHQSRGAW